ncbi:MAG: hypothetical protein WBB28_01865 [Crinalium sp.]
MGQSIEKDMIAVGVLPELAKTLSKRIRYANRYHVENQEIEEILNEYDKAAQNSGIEYCPSVDDDSRGAYGLEYSNTGETYSATLIYDRQKEKFHIGSWGDMVEAYPKRFGSDVE